MRRAVEIKMFDGEVYRVSEEVAEHITEAMAAKQSHVRIGELGVTLAIASITHMDTVTVADYVAVTEAELPAHVDLDAIQPQSQLQERWLKILKLNSAKLMEKSSPYEHVPLLKGLDDLAQYEQTSIWPEYVPAAEWSERQDQGVTFIFIKRQLTPREYEKGNYAALPQYWLLREDEDGSLWVARSYPRIRGRQIPDGFEECTAAESEKLSYVRAH